MEEFQMTEIIISIASDFTKSPGGRYIKDGSFSGEEFRESVLVPALRKLPKRGSQLVVILDGTFGYASSFLDEAFGGLIREDGYELETLAELLLIKAESPHFQLYKRLAEQYMREATTHSKIKHSA